MAGTEQPPAYTVTNRAPSPEHHDDLPPSYDNTTFTTGLQSRIGVKHGYIYWLIQDLHSHGRAESGFGGMRIGRE